MARIFVSGSADGLARAAARSLFDQGCEVVLRARTAARAEASADLARAAAGIVTGDLRSATAAWEAADRVNALGTPSSTRVYAEPTRDRRTAGHAGRRR